MNVFGFFPTSYINKDNLKQKSSDSAGVLASFRHSFARFATVELNYGHAGDTQYFISNGTRGTVHTGAHEVTASYVLNLPVRHTIHGFILAGGGIMQFDPRSSGITIPETQSQNKPAMLYGLGYHLALESLKDARAQI